MENTHKRTFKRSENWLEEDKLLLKELIKERVGVIENKNTDANTNSRKVAAWADLHNGFNSMCKGGTRTLAQLKNQWCCLKMREKKKRATERKFSRQTGGGPPAQGGAIIDSNDISAWLPQEFTVEFNEFDSDARQIQQNSSQIPVAPIRELTPVLELLEPELVLSVPEAGPREEEHTSPTLHLPRRSTIPAAKRRKIGKTSTGSAGPAADIAKCEVGCRKQLHKAQMETQDILKQNAQLKQILLKKKIEYIEAKIKSLDSYVTTFIVHPSLQVN